MARALRIELENGLYHLTSRGIEKRNIFRCRKNRYKFLGYLKDNLKRFDTLLYAYALMDNHYHLLVQTLHPNLSRFMHSLNTSYAVYFNKRYKRVGSLFQGRYKAILVDKDSYLLELVRYIHLNPVRAGIVSYPEDYIWSSYQEYTGERKNVMIMTDWVSGYFGANWREDFIRFTQGDVRKKNPFNDLKASLILGSNKFVEKIKKKLPKIERNEALPSYKKLKALTVDEILKAVSEYYQAETGELLTRGKNKLPRRIAIYLTRKLMSEKIRTIGNIFGISESGVSKVCSRVKRDIKKYKEFKKATIEIEEKISA